MLTLTGSNGVNKTYSVEAWAAVLGSLGSLVSEALREEKIGKNLFSINTTLATPYIYILQPELMSLELKGPGLSVPGLCWVNPRHSNRVTNLQLQSLVRIVPARLWSSLNDSDI